MRSTLHPRLYKVAKRIEEYENVKAKSAKRVAKKPVKRTGKVTARTRVSAVKSPTTESYVFHTSRWTHEDGSEIKVQSRIDNDSVPELIKEYRELAARHKALQVEHDGLLERFSYLLKDAAHMSNTIRYYRSKEAERVDEVRKANEVKTKEYVALAT